MIGLGTSREDLQKIDILNPLITTYPDNVYDGYYSDVYKDPPQESR